MRHYGKHGSGGKNMRSSADRETRRRAGEWLKILGLLFHRSIAL
jgi:hypothetical protein